MKNYVHFCENILWLEWYYDNLAVNNVKNNNRILNEDSAEGITYKPLSFAFATNRLKIEFSVHK